MAGTNVAADHSVQVAVITAVSGVAVVIIGPIINDWLKSRRSTIDHREELIAEQAEFIEHLRAELEQAHDRERARG